MIIVSPIAEIRMLKLVQKMCFNRTLVSNVVLTFLAHQIENSAFFTTFNKTYLVNLYEIKL